MSELKITGVSRGASTVKRARRPLGVPTYKLPIPELFGFSLRWMNDSPGRIPAAQEGGYDFVSPDEAPGLCDVSKEISPVNTDLGSKVSRVVGVFQDGTPMRSYLMKIRKDWYDEDQAVKMQSVDEVAGAISRGALNENPRDKRYVKQISMS